MKKNLFLDKSKILMKYWMAFLLFWIPVLSFQAGQAQFFNKLTSVCGVFLCMFWTWEIYKLYVLMKEYKEFVTFVPRTDAIKTTLFRMKVCIAMMMIGLSFATFIWALNTFDWMMVTLVYLFKWYYIKNHIKLVNLLRIFEAKNSVQKNCQ